MKNIFALLLGILLLSIFSCVKADLSDKIVGSWVVLSLQLDSSSVEMTASNSYFVTFEEDGRYEFQTDVNTCTGTYTVSNDGGFTNTHDGCTKVGGDTEFSLAIVEVFRSELLHYEISGETLVIEGNGFIELEKR